MNVNVEITKEYFVDKSTGEQVRYYSAYAVLDGQKVKLRPAEKDKRLYNFILDKNYKEK